MQATAEQKAVSVNFLDRTEWTAGPWDSEPDSVFIDRAQMPLLMRRASHGAWFGGVGIDPFYKPKIIEWRKLIRGPEPRPIDIVDFQAPQHARHFDDNLCYVGYLYVGPNDLRPASAALLKEIPKALRDTYNPTYVTLAHATEAAYKLAETLEQLGVR